MMRTIEAVIDQGGVVHLLEPIVIEGSHRALLTILDEGAAGITPPQEKGDLDNFLNTLPRNLHGRSREDIVKQVQAERDGWS